MTSKTKIRDDISAALARVTARESAQKPRKNVAKYHVVLTTVYNDGGEEAPLLYGPFGTRDEANAMMQKLFDDTMSEDDGTYDGDDTDAEKFVIVDSTSASTWWLLKNGGFS